jgi:CheY-like chemotaxis protein
MQIVPLKILLADDDEDDRLLFTDALKELKIKTIVHTVNDGIELMEYLAENENNLPQLLFLDLNMPRKDGFECLKEIRSNRKFAEVAIAIYSTSLAEKDIEETFLTGANVYINKPKSFDGIKQALNTVVISTNVYQSPPFNIANFLLRIS